MLKNTTININPGTALGKRKRQSRSAQAPELSKQQLIPRSSRREKRRQRDSTVIQKFRVLMTTTLPILFPSFDQQHLQQLTKYILHIHKHKGSEFTVRYLKATEESVLAIILGSTKDLRHDKISIGKDGER
jgi:hypothetical protein